MNKSTREEHDNYYDKLQCKALDLSYKLRGMAYLMYNLSPEGIGSELEERGNHIGIAMLLEQLRDDAHDLYVKLDCVGRPESADMENRGEDTLSSRTELEVAKLIEKKIAS